MERRRPRLRTRCTSGYFQLLLDYFVFLPLLSVLTSCFFVPFVVQGRRPAQAMKIVFSTLWLSGFPTTCQQPPDYNALRTAQSMFERYREDAKRAIFFARWEAQQSGSAYIEPKHILLGLTHDADSKANQLFGLSACTEDFRNLLGVHTSAQPSTSVDLPLSNPSKRILAYAAE